MGRATGPVGQSTEVRGQPGRHAGVRGVEVVQERAGGLGAHVTQQHTLAPRVAVLHNEEAFAVHLGTKSSTEGLRPPRQDVGPHRGPGWLRASPRLHAARPQHRHWPVLRLSTGQELRSGPNTSRLAKSDFDRGSAPNWSPLDRHIRGTRPLWERPAAVYSIPTARIQVSWVLAQVSTEMSASRSIRTS